MNRAEAKLKVLRAVAARIAQSSQRPYSIGISGIDAAGKSTLSQELAGYLGQKGHHVVVVHLDDFHHPREVRRGSGEPAPECYYRFTFDFDRLISRILKPMREQRQLNCRMTLLDLETNEYTVTRHYNIRPESVVIVEGVFLFQPKLLPFFDLKVFIEISFDECLRRAVRRDVSLFGSEGEVVRRYRAKYIPGQLLHMEKDQPLRQADIVVRSSREGWNLESERWS